MSKNDEVHVNASHLSNTITDDKVKDEDWGSIPSSKKNDLSEDDDLEREINEVGVDEFEDDSDEDEVPVELPAVADKIKTDAEIALEKLQNGDMNSLISNLKKQQEELNARRAKQNHELDEEEAIIKKNLRVAMMLNGETPEEDLPRKRGRKPGSTNKTSPSLNGEPHVHIEGEPKRTASGKRYDNDGLTLKDAILIAMKNHMPNSTGTVKEITLAAMDPTKGGYKSTSNKPSNTVRIQVYALETEGKLRKNENGTYTLIG